MSSNSATSDRLAEWETLLKEAGHRLTAPRRMILTAVIEMDHAFDADSLLARVRQQDELISLATIYRTISLLEHCDLLRKADRVGDKQLYEAGSSVQTQAYVICEVCGKTEPLPDACLLLRERLLIKDLGYTIRQINLRVRVRCQEHLSN